MVMIDETMIENNYARFMEYVDADPRAEKLRKMYSDFHDALTLSPASSKMHFHNAFPGGYLDHVLRVTDIALKMAGMYKAMEGDINFTKQELIFAAMHHDLGKLGTLEDGPYYLDQDSDWHRNKRGEIYKFNDNLQYMKPPERGLWLLQSYGIEVTMNEWVGIKLADGLYDEGNSAYLRNNTPYAMKTNLPYILHWADHMACRVENDKTRF
jgi:hypothetical protein